MPVAVTPKSTPPSAEPSICRTFKSNSTVPENGFLGPTKIAKDVWIVRRLFSLGAGQTTGLTWTGLKGRLLGLLGDDPFHHKALTLAGNESNKDALEEEIAMVKAITRGETVPFPLDTTMTIVRKDGKLTLHSAVPLCPHLLQEVRSLGEVQMMLVPNLQHWLFLQEWLVAFPNVSVGLVPEACGEDLYDKMKFLSHHKGNIFNLMDAIDIDGVCNHLTPTGLSGRLLRGAPLNLNEFLFFHEESGTLIASDSFYGGHDDSEIPTWFARLWFKLTKAGSFRAARLPIYRTSRVLSHGNEKELLDGVEEMITDWNISTITFAHGTSPFQSARLQKVKSSQPELQLTEEDTVGDLYLALWRQGLAALK